MYFITPDHPTLKLGRDLHQSLEQKGVPVMEFTSLDATIDGDPMLSGIDCLYMTRMQREHDSEQERKDFETLDMGSCQLTPERAKLLRSYAPIMHPFPRDSVYNELPTSIDDSRAMYFRQARNGMWNRAALLVHLFAVEEQLTALYHSFFPPK